MMAAGRTRQGKRGLLASAAPKALMSRSLMSRSLMSRSLMPLSLAPLAILAPQSCLANETGATILKAVTHSAIGASLIMGMAVFALTTALLHLRAGRKWQVKEEKLRAELTRAQSEHERIHAVAGAEKQLIISWTGSDAEPALEGDWGFSRAGAPLAFGNWAMPADAQALQQAVERLKEAGEGFTRIAATRDGSLVEAVGRAVAGRAVLLLRDVSGLKGEILKLDQARAALENERDAFRSLMEALPHPVWIREKDRSLIYVNGAYVRAVEGKGAAAVVAAGAELMEGDDRTAALRAVAGGQTYRTTGPGIVAGQRHAFDLIETPTTSGSAGLAIDVTAREEAEQALKRQMEAHAATLDRIGTAVAIFDQAQRLQFRNAAFEKLWGLPSEALDGEPTLGEILDRLRADRKLIEDRDSRAWKGDILKAFTSLSAIEDWWLLPDGRTLHLVANPNPQGGVTWLFNDVTEQRTLESRVNALSRVQRETLDSLHEGVAVFGSDGRLKLFNPAFASSWRLEPETLGVGPHVDEIVTRCQPLCPDAAVWADLRAAVTHVRDAREVVTRRLDRLDGAAYEVTASPLPEGATLIAFADVTASVNVERALTERNDALVKASELRDNFVHHVSYELRSPLTNIIGFAQLLVEGVAGPLNDKQRDYAGHISRSSGALLVMINDILDLASIDNGTITLDIGDVDLAATIDAATQGLTDRLNASRIRLDVKVTPGLGLVRADARRLRQILFNLISNAVNFSEPGQSIAITAQRNEREVTIRVADQGRGIPAEVIERVFDRFETHGAGSSHRGVGLGLAIVRSFIELHGGRVAIESTPGAGTVVTCHLPVDGIPQAQAAE
jgi:signal transduction histidine kinase